MKDFFENKKDYKEMLKWCEDNLFEDSRDNKLILVYQY